MIREGVLPTFSVYSLQQMLLSFLNFSGGQVQTGVLHLFKAGPSQILPEFTSDEFTECDFPGYAAIPYALEGLPVNLPSKGGQAVLADYIFRCSAAASQNVLGYWFDDTSNSPPFPIIAERFVVPVPIINPGDFLNLRLFFPLSYNNQI